MLALGLGLWFLSESTVIQMEEEKVFFILPLLLKRYASGRSKEYYKSLMTSYREYFIPFLWNEK